METLKMCTFSVESNRSDAGWNVPNSIMVSDIKPNWRLAGGGVLSEDLTQDMNEAFNRAIAFTNRRIRDAERHLKQLQDAKMKYNAIPIKIMV